MKVVWGGAVPGRGGSEFPSSSCLVPGLRQDDSFVCINDEGENRSDYRLLTICQPPATLSTSTTLFNPHVPCHQPLLQRCGHRSSERLSHLPQVTLRSRGVGTKPPVWLQSLRTPLFVPPTPTVVVGVCPAPTRPVGCHWGSQSPWSYNQGEDA